MINHTLVSIYGSYDNGSCDSGKQRDLGQKWFEANRNCYNGSCNNRIYDNVDR